MHPSNFSQVRSRKDLQSDRLHPENDSHVALDAQNDFPRLVTTRCDQMNHCGENSVDSHHSDDKIGYDMVTGANPTPQMVPGLLTGRPMQSRNETPHQHCSNGDTLDTTLPAQQIPVPRTLRTQTQNLQ